MVSQSWHFYGLVVEMQFCTEDLRISRGTINMHRLMLSMECEYFLVLKPTDTAQLNAGGEISLPSQEW